MTDTADEPNLTDGQKTRLLDVVLQGDRPANLPSEDEQRGDLLCDLLRQPMPFHRPGADACCCPVDAPCQGLRSVQGPSLGELLRDNETGIGILLQIKERAKHLGENASSKMERDVFMAVYFAAIAAAWLHHTHWITEHSEADLIRFFTCFAQAPWMTTELTELLKRAGTQRKQDSPSDGPLP